MDSYDFTDEEIYYPQKMYNNRDWQIAGGEKMPWVCREWRHYGKNLYYGGPIPSKVKAENDYVECLVEEGGKNSFYTGSLEGARKLCEDGAEETDLQGKTLMPSLSIPTDTISMVAQFTSLADPFGMYGF